MPLASKPIFRSGLQVEEIPAIKKEGGLVHTVEDLLIVEFLKGIPLSQNNYGVCVAGRFICVIIYRYAFVRSIYIPGPGESARRIPSGRKSREWPALPAGQNIHKWRRTHGCRWCPF